MDERSDCIQKFLAEWEAQNKCYEAAKRHRSLIRNRLEIEED